MPSQKPTTPSLSAVHPPPWIFILVIITTIICFIPGINGRFLFDDYPQIYLNDNLRNISSIQDIKRLWLSGNAGPGGRPIALLSFAAQIAITGLNPAAFKLTNIFIHIINGLFVLQISRILLETKCSIITEANAKLIALGITSCWMLHPMGLTSVLYVVQRMNSLSATFSLIGLYIYARYRQRSILSATGLWSGYASLAICTCLSYLTKENGLLTIGYAYIIEAYIFNWKAKNQLWSVRLSVLRRMQTPIFVLAVIYLTLNPHIGGGYDGRPFNLSERLLTESRVLWWYARQIILPDISSMALYHDDIIVSRSIFTPYTTGISIIAHSLLITAIILFRTKFPLPTFGAAWYYVGHSLESTIYPLELVFEHRNYLPMYGLIFSLFTVHIYNQRLRTASTKMVSVFVVLIIAMATATAIRSAAWGNSLYPINEAERNPDSARANFDATISLLEYIKDTRNTSSDILGLANKYCQLSIEKDQNALSPYIVCLDLYLSTSQAIPPDFFISFADRARSALIHPGTVFTLKRLSDLVFLDSPSYTDQEAETIYNALLENPRSPTIVTSHVWFIYGLLSGKRGDYSTRISYIKKALAVKPDIFEFRLLLIGYLLDINDIDQASIELHELQSQDKFGLYRDLEQSFEQKIQEHRL